MLASGSADCTVKLWDVTTQTCMHTFTHHTNKVQSVKWNPMESTVLATASFDKRVVVVDARKPDAFSTFCIPAEVECMVWNPHNPATLIVR